MSSEEVLRSNEELALSNNQIISRVSGRSKKTRFVKGPGGFGAGIFVTIMIAVCLFLVSAGNLLPSAISDRLVEETDVQYADAVESKGLVFQQAMRSGNVPANTITKLKDAGVDVGYIEEGRFIESSEGNHSVALKMGDKIITADNFMTEMNNNASFYNAFNEATYSRAAYYYDESAQAVFRRIGSTRNEYSGDGDFEEVMEKMVGSGSDIDVNNVAMVRETITNENGEEEIIYKYTETGATAKTKDNSADNFIRTVSEKSSSDTTEQATLNAANTINMADTISKEQRSSLFFLAFMENISKMKAGEGNNSKINEAMNYLNRREKTEVVDINTGKTIEVEGSMLESPSLYAVLAGEKIDTSSVQNYSSDRVLKTIEKQFDTTNAGSALSNTVASTSNRKHGSIGRYSNGGNEAVSTDTLSKVNTTVTNSLMDDSFSSTKGIAGGEMLVEGAINVGKELAKASGATAGDAASVKSYAKLTTSVLALDAEVDRMRRSPFDITSKNTFLGSLVYKFAISMNKNSSMFGKIFSVVNTTGDTIASLLPTTYADDENTRYLTNFGDCETLGSINAVGSATCSMVASFDTSTLDGIFEDEGFKSFVERNTTLNDSGVRTINDGSSLANFIKYNDERITPVGITDGGILDSINNNSSNVSFISNILSIVKNLLNSSDNSKKIASGEAFVNSSSNSNWSEYKYAQRYVSLARATAALRMYDGDNTAYNNIRFFEGEENPVIAFINSYNNLANK